MTRFDLFFTVGLGLIGLVLLVYFISRAWYHAKNDSTLRYVDKLRDKRK